MRIRNIKNAKEIINNSELVITNNIFKDDKPLYIEIGCGKGNFIIETAKRNPNINFIGIERYESILLRAIKKVENIPSNLRFMCIDAKEIDKYFNHNVDQIYLNFSDPWPKNRHENRRLTSPNFLKTYDKLFKKEKRIEFKTDNMGLFEYSICSLSNYGYIFESINLDLQNSENNDNIMTEYEYKFSQKGFKIYKLVAFKK